MIKCVIVYVLLCVFFFVCVAVSCMDVYGCCVGV